MDTQMQQTIKDTLARAITSDLVEAVSSNPRLKNEIVKCKVRPVMIKNSLLFQIEEWKGKQVFHQNLAQKETITHLSQSLETRFRQAQISTLSEDTSILVSKKGTVTVKTKKRTGKAPTVSLTHNRQKDISWKRDVPCRS